MDDERQHANTAEHYRTLYEASQRAFSKALAELTEARDEAAGYRHTLESVYREINGDNFDGDSIVWCQTALMAIEKHVKAALAPKDTPPCP